MVRGRPAREPDEDPDEPRERDPDRSREDLRSFELRRLLDGASPREVLARLYHEDPLELWPRVLEGLREEAVLADAKRVYLRTVARLAHASMSYRGRPELADWIRSYLRKALEEIMEEEREEEFSGAPPSQDHDVRHDYLSATLGIEPAQGRRACVAFNALPLDVRQAYWAIVIERKSVNRYVAEGHGPPERVHASLERALEAIRKAIDPGLLPGEEQRDGT